MYSIDMIILQHFCANPWTLIFSLKPLQWLARYGQPGSGVMYADRTVGAVYAINMFMGRSAALLLRIGWATGNGLGQSSCSSFTAISSVGAASTNQSWAFVSVLLLNWVHSAALQSISISAALLSWQKGGWWGLCSMMMVEP
jgi:hypothetical protein